MSDNLDNMHRRMIGDLLNPPTEGTVRWERSDPPNPAPEPAYKTETITIRTAYRRYDETGHKDDRGEFDPRIGRVVIEGEVRDGARTDQ